MRRAIFLQRVFGDSTGELFDRRESTDTERVRQDKDHRYMVNVVSSAITNAPLPHAVATILNGLNKLHHLDKETDENLMDIFRQKPNGKDSLINYTVLHSRNYCIITEHAGLTSGQNVPMNNYKERMRPAYMQKGGIADISAMAPYDGTTRQYALDICIRAEINGKDREGRTVGYGFSIPCLKTQ